jgi:GNAT superfamily N-acetyltransferase
MYSTVEDIVHSLRRCEVSITAKTHRRSRHFLAFDGETLISHAVVTTRGVQPEGLAILRTAFVDAVSTLPSHQNQGYGRATMRRLAEHLGDYEIGCLQTDRTSFYEHLG